MASFKISILNLSHYFGSMAFLLTIIHHVNYVHWFVREIVSISVVDLYGSYIVHVYCLHQLLN